MFLFSFISNPGKARRQQQPEEYDDDMFQERMCDALAEFAEPYNPLPSQLAQFPRGFGQGRPFFAYVPSGSDRNLEGVLKAHCRELDIRCCTFTLIYTKRGRIVDETGQGGNVADGAGSEDLWCEVEPNPYGITYFHLGFDDLLGTCYEDWVVDPVNAFKESASLERIVKPSSRGRRSLVESKFGPSSFIERQAKPMSYSKEGHRIHILASESSLRSYHPNSCIHLDPNDSQIIIFSTFITAYLHI
ncbi:hypothetical protein JAAARDRAFT_32260 [Jaapia argillacea MUCL 33604]|uniref:Uncharacterized protein n=1 Tax=Jaapia argillacea MUCL 33604 TaxID=933084 RepID=A0A067Q2H1_9AGAM|nr:hypothetical protein JAAARDRAFT_32260 [Jaapia argillacea MUCL 33604]